MDQHWGTLVKDTRYGLRQLRNHPGLTTVIVLSLAFSIGANTSIFTIVNSLMLKSLPVEKPDQLLFLNWVSQKPPTGDIVSGYSDPYPAGGQISPSFSYPFFRQLEGEHGMFTALFGFAPIGKISVRAHQSGGADGDAEIQMVTGNYFGGLGIRALRGRVIVDEGKSTERAAVLSYGYWARAFGSDTSVLGKPITLNGIPFTIIGIAPAGFTGIDPARVTDIWIPILEESVLLPWGLSSPPQGRSLFSANDWWWLMIVGRMAPDVSEEKARAMLNVSLRQTTVLPGNQTRTEKFPVIQLKSASKGLDTLRTRLSMPLLILMAVVAIVLLIGCANIATLQLTSAVSRKKEIAVRLSIGASRARLIRQLLTESILLAFIGGIIGLLIATEGAAALLKLISTLQHPVSLDVRPDLHVLLFTLALSVITAILFGLAPVLRSTRADLVSSLKQERGLEKGDTLSIGKLLVIVQVALCLILVTAAGVFIRSFVSLANQSLGFNPQKLLLFRVDPTKAGYTGNRIGDFYNDLATRLQQLPQIKAVTFSQHTLLAGSYNNWPIVAEGHESQLPERIAWNVVGPGFLETMGIPLLRGRDITAGDRATSPKVAVVNEAMTSHFFPGVDPIGRRFHFTRGANPQQEYEIVGVAQNAKYDDPREESPPTIYIPYLQAPNDLGAMHFEVRSESDPASLAPSIRMLLRDMGKDIPLSDLITQTEQVDESLSQERLFARGSGLFGIAALLLAGIGLYGLMAYSVANRTKDIGIRMALGASERTVLFMVLRQCLVLVASGVLIGVPLALAATSAVSHQFYGVGAIDMKSILVATICVLCISGLAVYFPARKAISVDPILSLRNE